MFLEKRWCNLEWSDWAILDEEVRLLRVIPKLPGVYRIRIRHNDELAYIGQTGHSLRQRLRSLRRGVISEGMPFCDPHTAAPSLWAFRKELGLRYEVSAATVGRTMSKQNREGLEQYLIWRYRHEVGKSTMCNFGRTHPQYTRSKRSETGIRGGRLPEGEINSATSPSMPPLGRIGMPSSPDWMGLTWSIGGKLNKDGLKRVPSFPGVYKIMDAGNGEVVYFGQSSRQEGGVIGRLRQHSRKGWDIDAEFSYVLASSISPTEQRDMSDINLREAESDLIGYFYETVGRAPRYQFNPSGT